MRQKIVTPLFILLALVLSASFPANAQTKAGTAGNAATDSVETEKDPLAFERPALHYEPRGNRDPFESLAPAVERGDEVKLKGLFNYEGSSLKGIVSAGDDIYALVADEDGFGYVLRRGYRVFGGYVTDITEDAVHFNIVKYGRSLSIIMRLASSKATVFEEREGGKSLVQKPGITVEYMKGEGSEPDEPVIKIEDVLIPSLDTKTIEEEWFGVDDETEPDAIEDEEQDVRFFTLFDPPDGSVITVPYVLDWTSLEWSGVRYTLFIDDNADFSSPILIKKNIQVSSCVIGENDEVPTGTELFWKVLAIDSNGAEVMCRSTDMSFRIR